LGALPQHQGRCEDAHLAWLARLHPQFHPYFRGKTAWRECSHLLLPEPGDVSAIHDI